MEIWTESHSVISLREIMILARTLLFHDSCPRLSICHMTVSSDPIGTAMLGVLLLLSFPSLVTLVPPPSAPLPCRRCCDDLEQEEGSGSPPFRGFNHVPEVRTFINMTILKGNSSSHASAVFYLKLTLKFRVRNLAHSS